MRKVLTSLLLLAAPLVFAQTNKLQMVTYFPVPYVAYNDVTVTQFCEVGLLNQCQMNIGPGSPTDRPFALDVRKDPANPVNVLNTGQVNVARGIVNLNSTGPSSKVYSQDASHGMDAGVAGNVNSELQFNHAANISTTKAPRSVTGTSSTLLRALNLFPADLSTDFPACSSGATWKRLPLGYSGTSPDNQAYLVCGAKAGTGSCAGSKPATSQACSECGTQTRNVWCESGTWRTSSWTACPVKPNTTVSCGNAAYECGSSATRTVSCSGGTWTASAWNYSGCWNKYGGGQTRSCSAGCGTETSTATCSGASWSGSCWSPYGGFTSNCSSGCGQYGASSSCSGAVNNWNNCSYPSAPSCSCSGRGGCGSASASSSCSGGSCNYSGCYYPSSPSSCSCSSVGKCGSAGYNSSCSGGSCDYSSCTTCCSGCSGSSSETQSCGTCSTGKQTRTRTCSCNTWGSWSSWSACSGAYTPTCSGSASESAACDAGYSGSKTRTRTCTCGSWGAWSGWNTSSCTKNCSGDACCTGAKPSGSQSCGNCNLGRQTRSVTCNASTGSWSTGSWGSCTGAGCSPGSTSGPDGYGNSDRCNSSCKWESYCASGCYKIGNNCCARQGSAIINGLCYHPGCAQYPDGSLGSMCFDTTCTKS